MAFVCVSNPLSSAASTSEEVAAGQPLAEEFINVPLPEGDTTSAPISGFWLTTLRNHIGISELMTDRNAGALRILRDVRLGYLDGRGIGEDVFLQEWKEDKDLTKAFEVKKQRNKNMNRVCLVRKAHPVESLFSFFSPPSPPPEEEIDEDDEDAFDARAEIESRLELDYQIGEDIRNRIIPRVVDYFTGKALEFDADDLDSDEYSDDDFEDDESDVEDVPGPGRHRHAAKGRGAGKKGEGQEECKQQ